MAKKPKIPEKLKRWIEARQRHHLSHAQSILDDIPADLPEELFTTILRADCVRVERIVSQGHASPPGFWYDQEENEWVLVLEGSAAVEFEGHAEAVELRRGSHLSIPAHARHRVAWTDPAQKTVWLAIHYVPPT
jgi:cupin 2 domain-containing protein